MKTIKIVLSAFAMFTMISFTNAQTTEKTARMNQVESYIKQLDLTPEQAEKCRELSDKYSDLVRNVTTREERKKLTDEADAEAKKILTEEQYKKYYALKTANKNPKQEQKSARIPNQPHPSSN